MDVVADLPDVPAESHNIPPALSCQCARERFNWWMMPSEEAGSTGHAFGEGEGGGGVRAGERTVGGRGCTACGTRPLLARRGGGTLPSVRHRGAPACPRYQPLLFSAAKALALVHVPVHVVGVVELGAVGHSRKVFRAGAQIANPHSPPRDLSQDTHPRSALIHALCPHPQPARQPNIHDSTDVSACLPLVAPSRHRAAEGPNTYVSHKTPSPSADRPPRTSCTPHGTPGHSVWWLSERFRVAHRRGAPLVTHASSRSAPQPGSAGLWLRPSDMDSRAADGGRRALRGDSGGGLQCTRVHFTIALAACTQHAHDPSPHPEMAR